MPRIRAITAWADRKAGDEFDVSEDYARILCAPDVPGGAKAEYVDRAMQAVEQSQQPQQPQAAPEKRRYMRRDMRAQN
jgi:hypothetical protein